MNTKRVLILIPFIVALIMCTGAFSDQVRLKDGRLFQGEIVEENDETIKLKLDVAKGVGYLSLQKEDIRRIIRETPEERQRRIEETMRAKGLVKDGEEWITPEEKAARDAQRQAEQAAKEQQKAALQSQLEQLRQEQRKQQESEQAFRDAVDRSGAEMTGILKNIVLRIAFIAVIVIAVFWLLKRYFWD